ncbi:MAG: transglycosylase domain-containing protein [Verrucomicrobiales bacterium]|nr:transglycosylase domain-containing protein [Verrucomicrobiales bacterium]
MPPDKPKPEMESEDSPDDPRERFRRLTAFGSEPPEGEPAPSGPHVPGDDDLPGLGGEPTKLLEGDTKPTRRTPPDRARTRDSGDTGPSGPTRTPPPPLGSPRPQETPQVDEYGMPLPRRVSETDIGATQVTRSAFTPAQSTRTPRPARGRLGAPPQGGKGNAWLGCFIRMSLIGLFSFVLLGLGLLTFAVIQYFAIAASLPSVDDLRERASQFETTRILDRDGNLLYEILDPNAGRRTYIKLEDMSPFLVAATIATEDNSFYTHPGFSIVAIFRAFIQNTTSGETVSGASTITQQLARNLLFTPEEASERSYMRKVREAILATEITRRYSKDEILELYLNEVYYGNLAYGVEAAAETYFNTTADKLTLAQAAFLAGLPQAPSVYDVYTNRAVTLLRQQDVVRLMYETSQEQNCIFVSNNPQPVCVDLNTASVAAYELESYQFPAPDIQIRYPHWVNYIRLLLEEQYDPQTIYRSGFTVYTTLDPTLQDLAQATVQKHVLGLREQHAVQSGALVAIRPSTGEILAMVGSADYYDEDIDGQINMAISPRQPGSSIKPFTYTAAFEKGWTAATLIWDVRSEFPPSGLPTDPREPYIPVNYDERYHGPVTVRYALANSYNIPAVKTLDFVGIYDNPETPQEDGMIEMAHRLGITTLNEDYYGLSLTLGGGEITLLDHTSAYAVFANGGRRVPTYAITKITDFEGNVVFEYSNPNPNGEQVIRAEHAFLISSILSDNRARTPAFGPNSLLNLPFQVAVKTGTTDDFRDNWTMGYTPDVAVGVWVGNPDYTPMRDTSGVTGAAPIWAEYMQLAIQEITGGNPTPFFPPSGIVEKAVCSVSGAEASRWCPDERLEYFASDQPPLPSSQDLWREVVVDTWTGLEVSDACGDDFVDEFFVINVTDPWAKEWLTESSQGRDWAEDNGFDEPLHFAPERECRADDPRPILEFLNLEDEQVITDSPLEIAALADATANFERYTLAFSLPDDPDDWQLLERTGEPASSPQIIYTWDLSDLPPGPVNLRLYMESTEDTFAEIRIQIIIAVPTPTPTSSPTPTNTPLPTLTPTPPPTDTPLPPTDTSPPPTSTPTPTPTLVPSETPTPTPT